MQADLDSKNFWQMDGLLRLVGLTLLCCVVEEIFEGVWYVHTGDYFPWRHFKIVPIYSTLGISLQWIAMSIAGAMLLFRFGRAQFALWLGAAAILSSLLQSYQNQRCLTLIVLIYLAIDRSPTRSHARILVRYQIVIVYLFSALNKLLSGFQDGSTLRALSERLYPSLLSSLPFAGISPGLVFASLGVLTILIEFAMPLILIRWPRQGFVAVVLLHVAFSLALPGTWPFTFIMIAMALLYVPDDAWPAGHFFAASR